MPNRLTIEQRVRAIQLLELGLSLREVAARIGENVHYSSISRLKKKYKETNSVYDKKKTGRPRKLTDRDERIMVRRIMTDECSTGVSVQKSLKINDKIEVSERTVQRALNRNGLFACAKCKKPLLSKTHREKRLKFARKYQKWTVSDWSKVVWSDESKFQIFGSDGRAYCWKKKNEPLNNRHVKPTVKFGGGSVFVWGCFTCFGVGYLCKIDGGLDAELYRKILDEDFLDTLEYYNLDRENIIFQQDNDPKHTAKRTLEWFGDNNIQLLSWPPQSPDLNPIEHLWNDVDRRLRQLDVEIRGKDALWEHVSKIWNETLLETCTKLINTMPERINDVLKAKGGYTRW
ncbi:unnamed protein product [Rhizophagus irregularis]|nr:unnamed protein product [Rhizophagus irregularis]